MSGLLHAKSPRSRDVVAILSFGVAMFVLGFVVGVERTVGAM